METVRNEIYTNRYKVENRGKEKNMTMNKTKKKKRRK